jgi:hypothetical protein
MPTSTPRVPAISDVAWSFNSPPTTVTLRATTDIIGKLTVAILVENANAAPTTLTEATSAIGARGIAVSLPAGSAGKAFRFMMVFTPDDTTLRSVTTDGGFRVPEARTVANGKALPVRWNTFGDGTRPANGGAVSTVTQAGTYMMGGGNWSSYQWSQYNPKGTVYPAP